MRHIAELCYPGKWLDDEDHEWCLRVENGFHHLERFLAEGAIALDLFQSSIQQHERSRSGRGRKWSIGGHASDSAEESNRVSDRARGSRGRPRRTPESYEYLVPYVHARAFVAAMEDVDTWLCALDRLVRHEESAGDSVEHAGSSFASPRVFAEARGGERAERSWRTGEQAVAEGYSRAAMLVLEQRGEGWIAMRVGGEGGKELEVSSESLFRARDAVQDAIDALGWRGPRRIVP